jgi:DNA polymerase
MESDNTYWADRALLEWQLELGASDAIQDTPVDRFALEAAKPKAAAKPAETKPNGPPPVPKQEVVDGAAVAVQMAASATDLDALRHAVENFAHCDLRKGARHAVFATGNPSARVMIIGEAPSRPEDRAGAPFVGEEGLLLDKMLAAIGLSRDPEDVANAAYLAAPFPWRPPNDGPPSPADAAMMKPFLERHIALANPAVLIVMGNTSLQMLTGQGGLTRRRGIWAEIAGRPTLPMFHPGHLLRNTAAKREAWSDLLSLKAKLKDLT